MPNKIFIFVFLLFCSANIENAHAQQPVAAEAAPISYGFVVDNSGSYRVFIERIITMVTAIAETITDKDEAFLITFVDNTKTSVRQEFTSDKAELKDAAENMFIEGGQTMVLDAVRLSIDYLSANAKPNEGRRRAILLITDGDDRGSSAKVETVISAAKNANAKLIIVGMSEEKVNTKLLDRLAKETGGRVFYPRTPKEAIAMTADVAASLRGN